MSLVFLLTFQSCGSYSFFQPMFCLFSSFLLATFTPQLISKHLKMDGMNNPQKLTLAPIVFFSVSCHCFPGAPITEPVLCSGYEALGLTDGGALPRGGEAPTGSSPGRWLPERLCSSARRAWLVCFNCVSCKAISAKQSWIKGLLTTNEIRRRQQFVILPLS